MHFLIPMLARDIVSEIASDKLEQFISEKQPTETDISEDSSFEDELVEWLNDQVDIPFMSEELEEDVIRAVIGLLKNKLLSIIL